MFKIGFTILRRSILGGHPFHKVTSGLRPKFDSGLSCSLFLVYFLPDCFQRSLLPFGQFLFTKCLTAQEISLSLQLVTLLTRMSLTLRYCDFTRRYVIPKVHAYNVHVLVPLIIVTKKLQLEFNGIWLLELHVKKFASHTSAHWMCLAFVSDLIRVCPRSTLRPNFNKWRLIRNLSTVRPTRTQSNTETNTSITRVNSTK